MATNLHFTFYIPAGQPGADGAPGATGATGAQGQQGLQGLQGIQGPRGYAGQDGSQWLFGTNTPSSSQGVENDWFVNTTTWDVYRRSSVAWTHVGNIKGGVGTDGSVGADGKSAFQIWLDNGNSGTEIEFMNWIWEQVLLNLNVTASTNTLPADQQATVTVTKN